MFYVDISWKTEQHQILVVLADPFELPVTFGVAKEKPEVAGTFPESRASARAARSASHCTAGPNGKNRPKIRAFCPIGTYNSH